MQLTMPKLLTPPATVFEILRHQGIKPPQGLPVLAKMIYYAIFGANRAGRYAIARETKLVLPERPQWLRPVVETPLGEE